MINRQTVISSSHVVVMLKQETLEYVQAYLERQGETFTATTLDNIIQEWVNWQKKVDEE